MLIAWVKDFPIQQGSMKMKVASNLMEAQAILRELRVQEDRSLLEVALLRESQEATATFFMLVHQVQGRIATTMALY